MFNALIGGICKYFSTDGVHNLVLGCGGTRTVPRDDSTWTLQSGLDWNPGNALASVSFLCPKGDLDSFPYQSVSLQAARENASSLKGGEKSLLQGTKSGGKALSRGTGGFVTSYLALASVSLQNRIPSWSHDGCR